MAPPLAPRRFAAAAAASALWLLAGPARAATPPKEDGSCPSTPAAAANAVSMLQPGRAASPALQAGPSADSSKEAKDAAPTDVKAKDAKAPVLKTNLSIEQAHNLSSNVSVGSLEMFGSNSTEADPCIRAKEAKKALEAFHQELKSAEAAYNRSKDLLDSSNETLQKIQDALQQLHKEHAAHKEARSLTKARVSKNKSHVAYLQEEESPWNLTAEESARMETVLPGSSVEFSALAMAVAIDDELCKLKSEPVEEETASSTEEPPSPSRSSSARLGLAFVFALPTTFALRA